MSYAVAQIEESLTLDAQINARIERIEDLKERLKHAHTIPDEMELLSALSQVMREVLMLRERGYLESCR